MGHVCGYWSVDGSVFVGTCVGVGARLWVPERVGGSAFVCLSG